MELTTENKEILKAMSKINSQVYFTSDVIGISTNDKGMIAYYDYGVEIDLPTKEDGFGIYNLNELMQIIDTYEKPTLKETKEELVISEGGNSNKYRYAQKDCITVPPEKDVILPKLGKVEASFTISKAELEKLIKQSTILRSPHIQFKGKCVYATDMDDSSANVYKTAVAVDKELPDVFISAEKFLNVIENEYLVKVTKSEVILESADKKLTYIILCLVK